MNFKWYLALVLVLWAMCQPAKAGDLDKHLEGKKLVYVGVCWFDKNGVLTFDNNKKKAVIKCAVGMAIPDQTKHYILLYYNDKPAKLVMYDETTKKQVTLWVGEMV